VRVLVGDFGGSAVKSLSDDDELYHRLQLTATPDTHTTFRLKLNNTSFFTLSLPPSHDIPLRQATNTRQHRRHDYHTLFSFAHSLLPTLAISDLVAAFPPLVRYSIATTRDSLPFQPRLDDFLFFSGIQQTTANNPVLLFRIFGLEFSISCG